MNEEQRARVKLAALRLIDMSYRAGWLSDQVVGIDDPTEYKLKIGYFASAVRERMKALDTLLETIEEIIQEIESVSNTELKQDLMEGVSTDEENLIELGHRDDPEAPPLTYRDAPAVEMGLLDSFDRDIARGKNAHILEEALEKIAADPDAGCSPLSSQHVICNIDAPICAQMIARNAIREWHT